MVGNPGAAVRPLVGTREVPLERRRVGPGALSALFNETVKTGRTVSVHGGVGRVSTGRRVVRVSRPPGVLVVVGEGF